MNCHRLCSIHLRLGCNMAATHAPIKLTGSLGQEGKIARVAARYKYGSLPWITLEYRDSQLQLNHLQLRQLFDYCIEVYGVDGFIAIMNGTSEEA